MVKVAMIDSGVQSQYLKYIEKSYNITENGVGLQQETESSTMHGSICSYILKKYYMDCEITVLNVFHGESRTNIECLSQALAWCLDNEIEVISISLGSCQYGDKQVIEPIIEELLQRGTIIVAAANNHNSITYPASMNGVIGVKCDLSGTLDMGEIAVDQKDIRGIEISVGTLKDMDDFRQFDLGYNNSFVVPYITAKILEALAKRQNIWTYLKNRNTVEFNAEFYTKSFPLMYKADSIIVSLEGESYESQLLEKCVRLFCHEGYHAIGITDESSGFDKCYSINEAPNVIPDTEKERYLVQCLNPDIVFINITSHESSMINDCIIHISNDGNRSLAMFEPTSNSIVDENDIQSDSMQYIGNYGNYGITVTGNMNSIKPEDFYFEGDIDEAKKKEILDAISSEYLSSDNNQENDPIVVSIQKEEINSIVSIIENIFT